MEETIEKTRVNVVENVDKKIKYCLYARKSTEQEDKQALSIESQVREMTSLAEREGLEIVEIKRESHSSKEVGQRPVYNELISEIRESKFNGILTWAPDRLSRNAGDLGSVVDLMDQKLLIEIRTYGQKFTNNPNEKFLLMILGSQAKLENDNKMVNVLNEGLEHAVRWDYGLLFPLQDTCQILIGIRSVKLLKMSKELMLLNKCTRKLHTTDGLDEKYSIGFEMILDLQPEEENH